jgi:hypothetical protein
MTVDENMTGVEDKRTPKEKMIDEKVNQLVEQRMKLRDAEIDMVLMRLMFGEDAEFISEARQKICKLFAECQVDI